MANWAGPVRMAGQPPQHIAPLVSTDGVAWFLPDHLDVADFERPVPKNLPTGTVRPGDAATERERRKWREFLQFLRHGVQGTSAPKAVRLEGSRGVTLFLLPPSSQEGATEEARVAFRLPDALAAWAPLAAHASVLGALASGEVADTGEELDASGLAGGAFVHAVVKRASRDGVPRTLQVGMGQGLLALFAAQAHADLGGATQHVVVDEAHVADWDGMGLRMLADAGLSGHCELREVPSREALPAALARGERFQHIVFGPVALFDRGVVDFVMANRLLVAGGILVFTDISSVAGAALVNLVHLNFSCYSVMSASGAAGGGEMIGDRGYVALAKNRDDERHWHYFAAFSSKGELDPPHVTEGSHCFGHGCCSKCMAVNERAVAKQKQRSYVSPEPRPAPSVDCLGVRGFSRAMHDIVVMAPADPEVTKHAIADAIGELDRTQQFAALRGQTKDGLLRQVVDLVEASGSAEALWDPRLRKYVVGDARQAIEGLQQVRAGPAPMVVESAGDAGAEAEAQAPDAKRARLELQPAPLPLPVPVDPPGGGPHDEHFRALLAAAQAGDEEEVQRLWGVVGAADVKNSVWECALLQPNAVIREVFRQGEVVGEDGAVYQVSSSAAPVSPLEGIHLYQLVKDGGHRRCLEVGMALGMSTMYLAQGLLDAGPSAGAGPGVVVSVDPFQRSAWKGVGLFNVRRAGLAHLHELREEPDWAALPALAAAGERFDLVLVDGLHMIDHQMLDMFYGEHLLRPGGVMLVTCCTHAVVRACLRYAAVNWGHMRKVEATPCGNTMVTLVKEHEVDRVSDSPF